MAASVWSLFIIFVRQLLLLAKILSILKGV